MEAQQNWQAEWNEADHTLYETWKREWKRGGYEGFQAGVCLDLVEEEGVAPTDVDSVLFDRNCPCCQ
jgi:hypothetical protein